jgi:CO dehydrogenase/acetyl-CoA synthase delta subunit
VLTIRDITEIDRFAKVSAANKMLSLLTSTVTHEMITPLKCVIQFGTTLLKSKDPNVLKEAELIVSTAKLLLSQVKLTLDKNMLDNNAFVPNFEYYPLNKTIIDVTRILDGQASL